MNILVVLVILCSCYLITRVVLRAERSRPPTPTRLHPLWLIWSGAPAGFGVEPYPVWSALDDLQLTRLLISSAPRTISE